MVATNEESISGTECHVTVCEEPPSLTGGESVISRQCDTGHERLLDRIQCPDSSGIAHCRAARPPNYLYFAVLVSSYIYPFDRHAIVFLLLSRSYCLAFMLLHNIHNDPGIVSLCNCPFGCLAILFSLLSRKSLGEGNFEDAKSRGLVSKWLSIAGVAVAIVATAFLIVYFVYIDNNIVDTEKELRGY